ncbi:MULTISPECIES: hypothetical protein [Rhodococcus]|uniref:hypothetical protein n=1 Tax=Rhodococcus TaxID=1827 RepID=UPI000AE39D11|nr:MULTISPECIES: hypothetical protein [Rhodococcus]MBT2272731.1 hypothetical protein [Rhodococcus qingshengii]
MTTKSVRRKSDPRSLAVRTAAAQAAVKASEKTGRAVDARVKKLAESAGNTKSAR